MHIHMNLYISQAVVLTHLVVLHAFELRLISFLAYVFVSSAILLAKAIGKSFMNIASGVKGVLEFLILATLPGLLNVFLLLLCVSTPLLQSKSLRSRSLLANNSPSSFSSTPLSPSSLSSSFVLSKSEMSSTKLSVTSLRSLLLLELPLELLASAVGVELADRELRGGSSVASAGSWGGVSATKKKSYLYVLL